MPPTMMTFSFESGQDPTPYLIAHPGMVAENARQMLEYATQADGCGDYKAGLALQNKTHSTEAGSSALRLIHDAPSSAVCRRHHLTSRCRAIR